MEIINSILSEENIGLISFLYIMVNMIITIWTVSEIGEVKGNLLERTYFGVFMLLFGVIVLFLVAVFM